MNAEFRATRPHEAGPSISEEVWIMRKLNARDLFAGVTTMSMRRERLRMHLVTHGLANLPAGTKGGEPESWAQLFERLFLEPLVSTTPTNEDHQHG